MTAPRNILVIRLSAMGDVVMASPLTAALKRTYPQARVSWLVEEAFAGLLEADEDLDEVIAWPRGQWKELAARRRYLKLLGAFLAFTGALRRRNFDLAVDAQGLLKSGIWAFLSGARTRVGIGSREGSRHLMTKVVDRRGAGERISSQYRLLADQMGLDLGDFRMRIGLDPDARRFAEAFSGRVSSDYALFCPFTTRPQKHWFEDRWLALAEGFGERFGMKVVLLGGPGDRAAGQRMAAYLPDLVINMAGQTTLQQAAALVKASSLLVGVDTGLTHMGIALDVPTIALFGSTAPYLVTEGTSGTVLYHPMECSPCRRNPTCDGDHTCMKAITVDEVLSAAASALASRGGAS